MFIDVESFLFFNEAGIDSLLPNGFNLGSIFINNPAFAVRQSVKELSFVCDLSGIINQLTVSVFLSVFVFAFVLNSIDSPIAAISVFDSLHKEPIIDSFWIG
jgi:hypothetical protein